MKDLIKGLLLLSLFVSIICLSSCSILKKIFKPICSTCPIEDCGPVDFAVDSTGNKYKKGELVLSFPDSLEESVDTNIIKEIIYAISDSINPDSDNSHIDSIKLTKCICDENIFLINSKSIIDMETTLAEAANTTEEIRDEGGIFSLNFIIEHDKEEIPKGIVNYDEPINDGENDGENDGVNSQYINRANNSFANISPINTSPYIVAILDSGIDLSKFSDYRGFHTNFGYETPICGGIIDPYGYNFIGPGSPNNSIKDFNGHGTVVSLAYKSKLESMGDNWANQRMLTVRVLDECGNGTSFSTACGLSYARQKGACIINCSWGTYFNDIQLQRAILQIPDSIAIVCSAGNSSKSLSLPDSNAVHFPSGYGSNFELAQSDKTLPKVNAKPKTNVYEVLAIDHKFLYSCNTSLINTQMNIAGYSNKRGLSFAEPASNVEKIIPNNPCPNNEINGTSFAAPTLSAGLIHLRLTPANVGPVCSRPPIKSDAINRSLTIGKSNRCYSRLACGWTKTISLSARNNQNIPYINQ